MAKVYQTPEAKAHTDAAGAMDLVSVVSHELGHLFGFEHDDIEAAMDDTLDAGVRRLPSIARNALELGLGAQSELVGALDYNSKDSIESIYPGSRILTATSLASQEINNKYAFVTGIKVSELDARNRSEEHNKPVDDVFSGLKQQTADKEFLGNLPADSVIPPKIDWTSPILDKGRDNPISGDDITKPEAGEKAGGWLRDFLGNLGGAKNPNDAIKITLPEETAVISTKRKEDE